MHPHTLDGRFGVLHVYNHWNIREVSQFVLMAYEYEFSHYL